MSSVLSYISPMILGLSLGWVVAFRRRDKGGKVWEFAPLLVGAVSLAAIGLLQFGIFHDDAIMVFESLISLVINAYGMHLVAQAMDDPPDAHV